jgi:hypothetical protein
MLVIVVEKATHFEGGPCTARGKVQRTTGVIIENACKQEVVETRCAGYTVYGFEKCP